MAIPVPISAYSRAPFEAQQEIVYEGRHTLSVAEM